MKNLVESVRDFYNSSGEYFSKTRAYLWPEISPYLDKIKEGDCVLDLGCGNGRLLSGIKTKVNYLGIDFSQTLLSEAEKLHPGYKFLLADITKKETWDDLPKFNAIFCVATLHHIPTKKRQLFILRKARRYLKKEGFLYLSVWNLWQSKYLKHHISVKSLSLKIVNWRWLYFPFQGTHHRFCVALDKGYLKNLLNNAGFKKIDLFYSGKSGAKTNVFKAKNLCAIGVKT